MTKKLLVATRNQLLVWDNGVQLISKAKHYTYHYYYGITWNAENIYISERKGKSGAIIKEFDKGFNLKRRLPLGVELVAPHQIFWWGKKLYITDTEKDRVLIWDGKKAHIVKRWRKTDQWLLPNSIWCDGKRFYILEHRARQTPKYVQIMDLDFKPVDEIVLPRELIVKKTRKYYGVHNVYIEKGLLYVLSPRELMQYNLSSKKIKQDFENYSLGAITEQSIILEIRVRARLPISSPNLFSVQVTNNRPKCSKSFPLIMTTHRSFMISKKSLKKFHSYLFGSIY